MSNAHPLRPREKSAQVARDRTVAHLGAALGIDEARRVRLARRLLERNVAARVQSEQLDDQRRDRRIGGDDLFTVRAGNVAIAERTLGRSDALLGLFLHSLARLLGQVVDEYRAHDQGDEPCRPRAGDPGGMPEGGVDFARCATKPAPAATC